MERLSFIQPDSLREQVNRAAGLINDSTRVLAVSHIDADGITSLAIVVTMLERLGKTVFWRNIHQLNSETILDVKRLVGEFRPNLVIFTDLGSGQMNLVRQSVRGEPGVEAVVVLDHHIPSDEEAESWIAGNARGIVEVNPCQHGMVGSSDLSGAGLAFLVAYVLSTENVDLSELAVVGATGDLQDYYGRGFTGLNKAIIGLAQSHGYIKVHRDLTFFGISTRPLQFLLEYTTDPYLPGITGNRGGCFDFFNKLGIPLKDSDDNWRTWADLERDEKKRVIQTLIDVLLQTYESAKAATAIIGDVMTLIRRPPKTDLRTAKEFSTLLNACGRNKRAEVGVRICFGDSDAWHEGQTLLQQHRSNLASALRRLETGGVEERPGMYLVMDPETPDTIVGVVIGMAQGSRIIPTDKPVVGVSAKTSGEGPMLKVSGRAANDLVKRGVNLREVFVTASKSLNDAHGRMVAEGGGHPMAAGAFVHSDYLDEFLDIVSNLIAHVLQSTNERKREDRG
jgi:RecJ-like exonuclease